MILSLFSERQFQNYLLRASLTTLVCLVASNILIPKGDDVFFINGLHSPFLNSFFITLTQFGSGLIFIPLIIALLFVEFRMALMAALSGIIHGLLIFVTKKLLFPNQHRPTALLDNDLLYFVPDVDVHVRYSFPSGHTATIFTVVILICLIVKRKDVSILLLTLAVFVGISRIYLLQHFLQDVVGGAIIGMGGAFISFLILSPTKKWPAWMSQRIKVQIPNSGKNRGSLSPSK